MNKPPVNAFRFTAYGKQLAIFIRSFDVHHTLRTVVQDGDNWQYVTAPSILKYGVDTKEEIDAEFIEAIEIINQEIEIAFGKDDTTEPEAGVERVQWLIDNKLYIKDNKICVM